MLQMSGPEIFRKVDNLLVEPDKLVSNALSSSAKDIPMPHILRL